MPLYERGMVELSFEHAGFGRTQHHDAFEDGFWR